MYRIWFTFRNGLGENVRDYLDDNGKGFSEDDAISVSSQLKSQGHANVRIVMIGSLADREEKAE